MMKRLFALMAIVLCLWSAASAVPAKPGFRNYVQSDGSQITVQAMGDEFFHYYITQDGLPLTMDDNGDFHYMTPTGHAPMLAHNVTQRTTDELSYIATLKTDVQMLASTRARQATARPRRVGETQVPTSGSPRVPIILIEYKDKKMSNGMTQFENQYKTGAKSVLQYFTDQSNGKYTPQYDLYGVYELPENRAYYGGNDGGGNDSCVATMVCHAIYAAGDDIDWSQYDNDGDGEADVCIVVYAGPGEAQGAPRSTIWPCQWDLASGQYYGDGDGAQARNGVRINRFAVFNETVGSSDSGTTMDGIGTFCHEFSHCLGLPDFYCTGNGSYYGMGNWSLMCGGCYNTVSISGDTPVGYSAYEKNFMGWIDYIEPVPNTHYTLPVFNSKALETDQAIKITSNLNPNEYFILENRRRQGWDQCIDDEGVLITHFTYIPGRWAENTPNNQAIQLATIIPADNSLNSYSENADLYGETNHAFTPTTTPAMVLNMKANGQLASTTGGAGALDKPVTDIMLNNDGTASLWYVKAEFAVTPEQISIKAGKGSQRTATFQVTGKALPSDVKLAINGDNSVFSLDQTTLPAGQLEKGKTVTVTFAPQEMTTYNATIDVMCEGLDTLTVTLVGQGLIESSVPVMQPAGTTDIAATAFRASWTDSTPAANVKSYTLHVGYKPQYDLVIEKDFTGWQDVTETYWYFTDYVDISNNLASYGLSGWSGTDIYSHKGFMQIGDRQDGWQGNNRAGTLTTPQFDLSLYDGKVTVVAVAKAVTTSTNLTLSAMCDGRAVTGDSQAVAVNANNFATYTQVLQGTAADGAAVQLTTTSGRPVQVQSLKIYAGEYSGDDANARLLAVVENGDSLQRVIEGITDKYYAVEGLKAYGTFNYWVEAVYVDDTHSEMSNVETVTLRDVVGLRGDVNGDGVVDIADVNIVINIMLGKDDADNYDGRAYVNDDKVVDIADVNLVINLMLGKE